jgi:hypothetical protein
MSRRAFLATTAFGVAGGVGGVLAAKHLLASGKPLNLSKYDRDALFVKYTRKQFTGKCVEDPKAAFAMPGRFPGKVVEVHHPASVVEHRIRYEPVQQMLARGMTELTGAPDAIAAWRSMFQKGDRVGIKVNPVGMSRNGSVESISNFATIMALIEGLGSAGIGLKDIILFERYANEFRQAGYEAFVERELPGAKWYASGNGYDPTQLDLEGRSTDAEGRRSDPDPHVLGYDRDVYRKLDFCDPKQHNANEAESFLSHASKIVTGDLINKIITIPVLKDHRSGGITIALKNISHGMSNNVARTHVRPDNKCGVFIPNVASMEPFRKKIVLNIMDGLIGTYEGGPGSWNNSWGTWEYKSLFFATDPVAMDHVGWDILDAERARRGWEPVAKMGLIGNNRSGTEQFNMRQPEHVELGGQLGLGVFDSAGIEFRQITLS